MNKVLSIAIYLFSLLPFKVLYFLSDILYYILYYLIHYRREVVKTNIQNSFPNKSSIEQDKIAKKYYRFLADLIVEIIKMKTISAKQMRERLIIINPEEYFQYLDNNKSIIMVTAHYGNWEWGIPMAALLSDHPTLVIYKPLNNEKFGVIFNKMRTRFGGIMVPMKQTFRKIMAYKDQAHTSVFLADQTPAYHESDVFINFLNQPTLVFKGIEKIAKKNNSPIVFCHIDRIKRGYYQCKFTTLTTQPREFAEREITILYNRFLENIICEKPELWLWSHRRWKHKPAND